MKSVIVALFLITIFDLSVIGQDRTSKSDSVELIQEFKNLYRFQNFYLGGQPTYETLLWLKSKGVTKIINLRSERENLEFAGIAFNEPGIISDLGIEYISLPVDGLKDYTPGKLASMDSIINANDIIFIHCASGGRVTDFFMGYLVKSRGYNVTKATDIGRKLKFSFPLEKLLDTGITFIASRP